MSRLGFLLLLWVFFLPGIKVYGSSETSASVDRMSFNAHWNTPIESMNGTLNLADDYYLTDGTPVTDRNYGEMNNGVLDVTRPNAAHLPTVTHGFTALCLYAACRGTARAGKAIGTVAQPLLCPWSTS